MTNFHWKDTREHIIIQTRYSNIKGFHLFEWIHYLAAYYVGDTLIQ